MSEVREYRIGVKMPVLEGYTEAILWAIRTINGNPSLTAEEKKNDIKNLVGLPREHMMQIVNKHYRSGPGLHDALKHFVSKGRPRGAPEDSAKGTKTRGRPKKNK